METESSRGERSVFPGGDRGVLTALAEVWRDHSHAVLALVTDTRGSTYRKRGALSLIDADGRQAGALSGGCLEPELRRQALEALARDAPRCVVFDTQGEDDLVFGSGSGCRGRMRVALLPLARGRDDALVAALARHLEADAPTRLALVVDGGSIGALALVGVGIEVAYQCPEFLQPVLAGLACGDARLVTVDAPDATREVACLALAPNPRVLLIGAGPEAVPLLRLLRTLGWFGLVLDHRPGLAQAQRLPDADAIHLGRPDAALAAIALREHDAAVVMSHTASVDLEALRALAATEVGRIALLGPPARRDELLALLEPATRASVSARLDAPAGIRLGGEGPEAIALSIAAGLQRHFAARA
jgi:xanthine dehydrogenase accessory factor